MENPKYCRPAVIFQRIEALKENILREEEEIKQRAAQFDQDLSQ